MILKICKSFVKNAINDICGYTSSSDEKSEEKELCKPLFLYLNRVNLATFGFVTYQ